MSNNQPPRGPFMPFDAKRLHHVVLATWLVFTTTGCASSLLNLTGASSFRERLTAMMDDDEDEEFAEEADNKDFDTRVETPLLRDYISVGGNNMIALRGVGLVTGLDGTGGDPPPSHLRTELLGDMKIRKIPHAGRWLADRNTALVMVTAYLPPMCRKGQKFDVRVTLPPNSEATSLKGGWLLDTRLSEERTLQGRGNVKGHMYATARGAILTALGADGVSKANAVMLRRGSVPGGAVSRTERDLEIHLRNEYRGLKTSRRIESAISNRLHHYNRFGQRVPMATAKTDKMLELRVHPLYRNNFPRYQQMIRSIAFRETDIARRIRIEHLAEELLDPVKAERASLGLEAIGADGVPFLIDGLTSDSLEVRFHAAQALAYLEDSSGVDVLKQAAIEEPAFRVYALAALSVIKDANGIIALRELMSSDALETRYGAVRALKENNPHDMSLGTTEFPNQFVVHAVESVGVPAVHVVRYRSPEIVVFGKDQRLNLPATLSAGTRIVLKGRAGDQTVTITRYELDKDEQRKTCSTNLMDIIRTLASMDASYPDIVQLLLEAETQSNLMGELGIDRLPQAGRIFSRHMLGSRRESDNGSVTESRLGTPSLTPGLFERVEDSDHEASADEQSALDRMFASRPDDEAGSVTVSEAAEEASEQSSDTFTDSEDMSSDSTGDSEVDSDEPFELESTEFSEPIGSKVRNLFRLPFGSGK